MFDLFPHRPRVTTAREIAAAKAAGFMSGPTKPDSYGERLVKYIPTEVVGAYLVLLGLFKDQTGATSNTSTELSWSWGIFWACLVLAILYTALATQERKGQKIQWFQVLAAPLAFTAWAFALGGPFEKSFDWYQPRYGSAVLIITSLAIPGLDKVIDTIDGYFWGWARTESSATKYDDSTE